MRNARCVATGDPPFFYKLLNNKGLMFSQPHHGVHWIRHVHRCSTTRSPPLYALPTRSYDPLKSGCSFYRTLYNIYSIQSNTYVCLIESCVTLYIVLCVPLATEPGISLIILPLMRILLRVATIRRTTDTHYRHIPLHFSHNERTPVQISLQYLHWC